MKFELSGLNSYDDASLIAELRRVAALISTPWISQSEFTQHSKASVSVIRHRFGGWAQALSKAGLGDRYSGTKVTERMLEARSFSDEELLSELKSVAKRLGTPKVTIKAFAQNGRIHPETIRRRFGEWWKALQAAGLEISWRRYSLNEYFENLLAVWTHYGRQPTYGEMRRPPSVIAAKTYEAKWGTWRKALMAFIDRANSDLSSVSPPVVAAPTPTKPAADLKKKSVKPSAPIPPRQVSLGLRYAILKRDNFRCVGCGVSPATHPGCDLHVDHIIPFSKGGTTVLENLQTLCAKCNVGKGNRL